MNKIKGVFVDVLNKKPCIEVIDYDDNLEIIYSLLKCETINIVQRKIGNNYYNFICDDDGLLKDIKCSCVDKNDKLMFTGNLLIVRHNDFEDTESLTTEQIKEVLEQTQYIVTSKELYPVIIADY